MLYLFSSASLVADVQAVCDGSVGYISAVGCCAVFWFGALLSTCLIYLIVVMFDGSSSFASHILLNRKDGQTGD